MAANKNPSSSVGKKFGMALTGLILYGFLGAHLAGNLLLFKGGTAFNAYSEYLINHPLLVPAELFLLGALVLHVWLAISTARASRRARPVGYRRLKAVGGRNWASSTMVYTGGLIFVFIVFHLWTFKYGDRGGGTLYDLVMNTFKAPLYAGFYLVAMVLLGFHLWHAFQSAFQSLGLGAQKLRPLSTVLSVAVAGGFGLIPLWAFFR